MDAPNPTLDQLLAPLDARDAIGAMLFASIAGWPLRPGRREAAAPVACEYVCMRLLQRGTVEAPPAGEPALVRDLVLRAEGESAAQVVTPSFHDGGNDPTGMETSAHVRFALPQFFAYDPFILEVEERRWPQLLGPESQALETATGLSLEAIDSMVTSLYLRAVGWCLHLAGADGPPGSGEDATEFLRDAVERGGGETVVAGSGLLLGATRDELARAADVSVEDVDRFLALLAIRPEDVAPDRPFEHVVWDLRRRPLVTLDERIFVPVPHNLLAGLRATLETALRDADPRAAARYDQHKAKWVEREALSLLTRLLSPDQAYRNLEVHAAGGRAEAERDGLLRVDLVALAVEVKGGGIAPAARRGHGDSQDTVFRRLIHEGVAQAESLIAALVEGRPVTGIEIASGQRTSVDIGSISRWIPLVITLEDMGGVVAGFQAVFGDRDPDRRYPVVWTLDDLEWFSRELELPAQVIHYMVVRERIARLGGRLVMYDEADWFGFYYGAGSVGVKQMLERYGQLDAAVVTTSGAGRRGHLDPRITRWTTPLTTLLERLRAAGVDGWLEASMALLDLSGQQAHDLSLLVARAREEVLEQGDTLLLTMVPEGDASVALQILVPSGSGEIALDDIAKDLVTQAPDAAEHVLLAATSADVDELDLLAVVVRRPAAD
ncbi:MAG: hypothetical protein ABW167_03245 [Baekduia sp.]